MGRPVQRVSVYDFEQGVQDVVLKTESIREEVFVESKEKEMILRKVNIDVYDYLTQHLLPERPSVKMKYASSVDELDVYEFATSRSLVNLCQVNDSRYINKFFNKVNECLPDGGMYIGCVETSQDKRRRLFGEKMNVFTSVIWFFLFLFHRVLPKLKYLRKVYYFITQGKYRWLTKAEVLGRLVSCGFDIIEFRHLDGKVYFVTMKTHRPDFNMKPSYGPFFPMKRVGKNGELIKVYKVRTMHPYSEYLQDFVIKLNGYNEVGKPANDFRLTSWGKFFRKCWLDEIPQLLNVLKGEMALVGVRPLSKTRFNELPAEIQKERTKYRPGCIPPYVALLMPDSDGNIEAERIYLKEKQKSRLGTDIKYFFKSVFNILAGKIRSS